MNLKYVKISFILYCFVNAYAGDHGQTSDNTDPYRNTNYKSAFDVKTLENFSDVLAYDGALANMPDDFKLETPAGLKTKSSFIAKSSQSRTYELVKVSDSDTDTDILDLDMEEGTFQNTYQSRKQEMIGAIVKKLKGSKRFSVLRPLCEIGIAVAIEGACTLALVEFLSANNYGASIGIFAFASTVGHAMKPAATAVFSFCFPGNDPYERWEQQFAEKMPYIPSKLWPKIIDTFGAARMGQFNFQKATDYFNIAFNLPSMHRFPYVAPLSHSSLLEKTNEINKFTDDFFKDYEQSHEANIALSSGVRTYLKKLAYDESGFVCMHLKGPGGIGKTHYIKTLAIEISKVLDQDIPVEEINIRSGDTAELEGSIENPGKVISSLSRIAQLNMPYGIIVFDEASWLNGAFNETAKKMFEPTLGCFNSPYLDGLEFSLQGFLIAFMSNDDINDPALKGRMINIEFPILKKESLKSMALNKLEDYLRGTGLKKSDIENSPEILNAIEKSSTMRDVGIFPPIAIEEILHAKNVNNL